MLVKKGGISRNIDDKRLEEYREKGYAPVEPDESRPKAPPAKKGEQA